MSDAALRDSRALDSPVPEAFGRGRMIIASNVPVLEQRKFS